MTDTRKKEVINDLQNIINNYTPNEYEPTEINVFGLISRYNATGNNVELIGGEWVLTNTTLMS